MSRDQAMAEARRLKAILERHGVKASIELQEGRPNRTGWGDNWLTRKVALMNHHTAGPSQGLTPSLGVCKRGRPDLPGPLCNGYGGRDLVYRIVTMGLANHPGQGGPMTLAGYRIPKDSARHVVWGTEWEHDGRSPWTPAMEQFMGRANNALLEFLGRPVEVSIEHKTWAPGRKPDRYLYQAADGQAEIRAWAGKPSSPEQKDEWDMDAKERKQWLEDIQSAVWGILMADPASKDPKTGQYTRWQTAAVRLNYANHAIYQVLHKVGDLATLVADEGMNPAERKAQAEEILAGVKKLLEEQPEEPAPPADPQIPAGSPGN